MISLSIIITTIAIFLCANGIAYTIRRNDSQFRTIVFVLSLIGSPIVGYLLGK